MGQKFEGLRDVTAPHLLQTPQQIPGIIQHDPWLTPLRHELRQQISHTAITLGKRFSVVVITLTRVLRHVLQMGNEGPIRARRHGGLMHVQSTGKPRTNAAQWRQWNGHRFRTRALNQRSNLLFSSADRRQTLKHGPK